MNSDRIEILTDSPVAHGPVVYWMSRDQRAADNWALLRAQEIALETRSPLAVAFCLVPSFLGASPAHFSFMLDGLRETESDLQKKSIPFFLLRGEPETALPAFLAKCGARALVADFDPLKIKRRWKSLVARNINFRLEEVDAHNIVPCRAASPKLEFAARTIRPKINRLLDGFLTDFPALKKHPFAWNKPAPRNEWPPAPSVGAKPSRPAPGCKAANKALRDFISLRLDSYDADRNNPNIDGQSGLSPYIHFGQLSAQRAALEIRASGSPGSAPLLEELVIRRELADNFCFYNDNYDSFDGFHAWAKKTLDEHRADKREYLYSRDDLEAAATHDELWNAAQRQMAAEGKMHGFMRMYWCKKILEWTSSPEEAMSAAIYLNDKYELDGRDPNGYAGIAWSIGGVHDRAWGERPVFGKIRYMSHNGCKSKFNVNEYIRNHQ
ncbi:MAG TPA: deoxyribodipyrimidine photo-lyase [bacterium]|nr:deoxyribodipyrimidine photo-lyase [bacterium]